MIKIDYSIFADFLIALATRTIYTSIITKIKIGLPRIVCSRSNCDPPSYHTVPTRISLFWCTYRISKQEFNPVAAGCATSLGWPVGSM